jgi:putative peptide zinc metalloprotease protein
MAAMNNQSSSQYAIQDGKPFIPPAASWHVSHSGGLPESFALQKKVYRLNPIVEISPLDMGHRSPMYQLLLGERRYQINEAMLKVLEFLRTPRLFTQIEKQIRDENLHLPSGKHLADLVEDYLLKNGIIMLQGETGQFSSPEEKRKKNSEGFLTLRIPLFSPERLQLVTDWLKWMYSRSIAVPCALFSVALHTIFFLMYGLPSRTAVASLSAGRWTAFVALAYLGVLIHELGHASACRRFGVRHGDIGIGLYIIYPVFYTNVTSCWSLSRWQRATVDIGGMFFQMTFSSLCCLAWFWSHSDILAFAILSNVATVVVNLNPFLRFDGYWLLTDLLGLSSIRRSSYNCWRYLWHKALRKDRPESSLDIFDVKPFSQAVVFVYSWISAGFFLVFFEKLARIVIPYLIHTISADLALLVGYAAHHDLSLFSARILSQMIFLLATCYSLLRMGFNFVKRGIEFGVKARRKSRQPLPATLNHHSPGDKNHVFEPRTIA